MKLNILNDNLISIVIRTIGFDLEKLERAIKSVEDSSYSHKEVVLVYQGNQKDKLESINKIIDNFKNKLLIKLIQNKVEGRDEQAKNLNIGIKETTGRYLGFLDDDDIIYKEHLSILKKLLDDNKSAWAYSQFKMKVIDENNNVISKRIIKHEIFDYTDLLIENFITIHSYLLDKKNIDNNILFFEENSDLINHYDHLFLIKLARKYQNPSINNTTTVDYFIKTDNTNTSLSFNTMSNMSKEKLDFKINNFKKSMKAANNFKKNFIKNEKVFSIFSLDFYKYFFKKSKLNLKIQLALLLAKSPNLYNKVKFIHNKIRKKSI